MSNSRSYSISDLREAVNEYANDLRSGYGPGSPFIREYAFIDWLQGQEEITSREQTVVEYLSARGWQFHGVSNDSLCFNSYRMTLAIKREEIADAKYSMAHMIAMWLDTHAEA